MAKNITPTTEREAIVLRLPPDLLAWVDEYAEAKKQPHTRANRNATIVTLLERAMADAKRSR